jgi:hypothetical protein
MSIRIQCLCIDSPDPGKVAAFWADALGWRRTFDEPDQVCLEPPAGSPEDGIVPDLLFLRVPEGKVVKNRLHLDVRVGTGLVGEERLTALEAECARLVPLGAARVRLLPADDVNESCIVMQDIEGNEFCLD